MVKLTKQCNNCHLDIDITPDKPMSTCPFCGHTLLYTIEETKQINVTETSVANLGIIERENFLPKNAASQKIFTVSNAENKYKKIAIGLASVLILLLGFFIINNFRSSNSLTAGSQNASYESASASLVKPTATLTKAPTPTATPIKQIKAPATADHYINQKYDRVKMYFRDAGFTNIVTYPLHDMAIDIFATHVGNVESISINGNIAYDTNTLYPTDAKVVIAYHSMK